MPPFDENIGPCACCGGLLLCADCLAALDGGSTFELTIGGLTAHTCACGDAKTVACEFDALNGPYSLAPIGGNLFEIELGQQTNYADAGVRVAELVQLPPLPSATLEAYVWKIRAALTCGGCTCDAASTGMRAVITAFTTVYNTGAAGGLGLDSFFCSGCNCCPTLALAEWCLFDSLLTDCELSEDCTNNSACAAEPNHAYTPVSTANLLL